MELQLCIFLLLGIVHFISTSKTPVNITAYCGDPIGLADGRVPDTSITANSVYNQIEYETYGAHRARLHLSTFAPGYRADRTKSSFWVKVELGEEWVISGIATQGYGEPSAEEWVTKFMIMYSIGNDFAATRSMDGQNRTFEGNSDSNTVKFNALPLPVIASTVTLYPLQWHNNVGLRLELYGCKPGYHIVASVSPLGFPFRMSYLDSSSEQYRNLAADIKQQIEFLLRNTPGFLSAKILRLNPAEIRSSLYLQTEAEVEIGCIAHTVGFLEMSLRDEIEKDKEFFDPTYVEFRHPKGKEEDCPLPSISVNLAKNIRSVKKVLTVDSYTISADVKTNCSRGMTLEWEVSAMYETAKAFSPFMPLWYDVANVTLSPHTFPPALLYVRLVASNNGQDTSVFDYGLIRIELPKLVAKISGTNRVTKGDGTIVLDATGSRDPDKRSAWLALTYTWYCRQEGENIDSHISIRNGKKVLKPNYWTSLAVDRALGRPHSSDKGCFGFGPGRLSSKSKKLDINVNEMKSGKKYLFTLVITKGKRQSSQEHVLQVDSYVNFTVRCHENCSPGAKLSQTQKISLSSECVGLKCGSIIHYRWMMYKETTSSKHGVVWKKVKHFHSKLIGEKHSPFITIQNITDIPDPVVRNQRLKVRGVVRLRVNDYVIDEEDDVIFISNSPPYPLPNKAGCVVDPKVGMALTTEFKMKCEDWMDEDGIATYEFRYQRGRSVVILQSGPAASTVTWLPLGAVSDDFIIPIEVRITDTLGDYTKLKLHAEVGTIVHQEIADIMHEIVNKKDNHISDLLSNNQTNHAAEMAIALLSLIDISGEGLKDEKNSTKNNAINSAMILRKQLVVSKDTAKKLKDAIINQMFKIEVDSWQRVTQVVTVVTLATTQKDELSLSSQEKALTMLTNAMDFMASRISNSSVQLTELEASVTNSFLAGVSNLLSVLTDGARMFAGGPKYSFRQMKMSKELTQKAVNQLRRLGDSILRTKIVDDEPSIFNSKTVSLILSKNSPMRLEEMSGSALQTTNREVNFPALGSVLESGNTSRLTSVQSKIIMFVENPFTWHSSNLFVKSWAIDINLYTGPGEYLKVSGLRKPVGIFIPEDTTPKTIPKEHYFIKPTYNISNTDNIRYHRFNLPNQHSSVTVKINPSGGKTLQIFVSAWARPLPSAYNYTTMVPDKSKCVLDNITGNVNCSSEAYEVKLTSNLTGSTGTHYFGIRYLVIGTDGDRSGIDESSEKRRVRRSCGEGKRHKRSICIGIKEKPTMPVPTETIIPEYNASIDVNYTMSISMTSCLYWSERSDTWTDSGCKPGPLTRQGKIHCLCDHLSAFGGDFFVEPNPIDFDKVYLALMNPKLEDFVVMTTVVGLFMLYVIALVFARRADRKDETKSIPAVYLTDRGSFMYQISVFTGMWKGSGTSANVGMVIYGENTYTEPIFLNDPTIDKTFFARGSTNTFYLYLPKSLGPLYKIRIWHDNEGQKPAWFLSQVTIADVTNSEKCHFLCNKWLALEKGDGEIEVELRAAEKKEIQGFKNVFHSRVSKSLADGHLWASVFMRPPQTVFTRVQRLSCCLSILFATMVTNAMFYQFGTKPVDTFQIGPLKISWMQVKIGLQSALIAIPVNAIVVTIFRNVRPKQPSGANYDTGSGEELEGGNGKKGALPHGFIYLGWLLCLGSAIGSAVVIILYSLSWGGNTANEWLTSIMVSFFQDVLVTQPIKVVLLASLLSLILKKPPKPDDTHGMPHWKNRLREKNFLPPEGEELEHARLVRQRLIKTARVILEIVTYIVFAILLFIVCYGNRKSNRFHMKDELSRLFSGFDEVQGAPDFWDWTDSVLLPGLYNVTWYNGKAFEYKEGFINDRENFLVGMPRLRQLRLNPSASCVAAEETPFLLKNFTRCLPYYTASSEDVTPYHTRDWAPLTNISSFQSAFELSEVCPRPWRYQEPAALRTLSYSGLYASYGGGGFVADLGYNAKSANAVLNTLRENDWIDNRTSAVFVEFTVFEPSSLLISAVKMLYERLPTGGVRCSQRIEALTVYAASDPSFRTLYQTCQLLFIGTVVFLFVCECVKAYKMGCSYLYRFWSWMDLILMISAILAMGTLFFKEKYVSDFIRGVHENPFKTSSTDFIVLWSQLEVYLLSFVIFIMTIKFLRLIRFNRHIGQLMGTLKTSMGNLASFYVVLLVVLIGFTEVGMLVFGSNIEAFSTFFGTTSVVLQKLLGTSMQMKRVTEINKVLGSLFVFAYSLAVAIILLSVFISILNTAYKETRESGSARRVVNVEIRKYIKDFLERSYREFREDCKDFVSKMKNAKTRARTFSFKHVSQKDNQQINLVNYRGIQRTDEEQQRLMSPSNNGASFAIRSSPSLKQKVSFQCEPISDYIVPEESMEYEPWFENVQEVMIEQLNGGHNVPLASFDEEDDICSFIDDLFCLEDIRASLIQIERDLLRATDRSYDDYIYCTDDDNDTVEASMSQESIVKLGSHFSLSLSLMETNEPNDEETPEHEFADYDDEENGIEDEDGDDDMHMFISKSPLCTSISSLNEMCRQGDRRVSSPFGLGSHDTSMLAPPKTKW